MECMGEGDERGKDALVRHEEGNGRVGKGKDF